MEVSDNIVGVVKLVVDGGVGEDDACHASDGKEEDESDSPEHGRGKSHGASPHGGDPAKYFYAGGNGDDHRSSGEVELGGRGDTGDKHVMRPDKKPNDSDGDHRPDHAGIVEDGFS